MPLRPAKRHLRHSKSVHKNRGGANVDFAIDLTALPDGFYRMLTTRLIRIAERMDVPRSQSEDVAQEAWLEAIENAEKFRGEHGVQQLCSWLTRRVVLGKAVDALRRLNRQAAQSLDALAMEPMDHKAAQRAENEEKKERLTALLARLRREDPENCWLLCEHHLQGRPIQELAAERGWTANEIACRLYRAKEKMRRWASMSGLHDGDTP